MKRNFYALMQSEDRKGSEDFSAFMIPEFSVKAIENFGHYEWYAGPKRWRYQIKDIQDQMVLVVNREYTSDVRQGSDYFYIISKKFLTTISELKHNFKQILKLNCIDKSGKKMPGDLYAAVPRKFFESECLIVNKIDNSIDIKPNFDFDLFDVKDISLSTASLICSEKAKECFINSGIDGVEYIPLEQIKYEEPDIYDFIEIAKRKWPV
jgi:hypothetical protein